MVHTFFSWSTSSDFVQKSMDSCRVEANLLLRAAPVPAQFIGQHSRSNSCGAKSHSPVKLLDAKPPAQKVLKARDHLLPRAIHRFGTSVGCSFDEKFEPLRLIVRQFQNIPRPRPKLLHQ